jgi:hypothetical protein
MMMELPTSFQVHPPLLSIQHQTIKQHARAFILVRGDGPAANLVVYMRPVDPTARPLRVSRNDIERKSRAYNVPLTSSNDRLIH